MSICSAGPSTDCEDNKSWILVIVFVWPLLPANELVFKYDNNDDGDDDIIF